MQQFGAEVDAGMRAANGCSASDPRNECRELLRPCEMRFRLVFRIEAKRDRRVVTFSKPATERPVPSVAVDAAEVRNVLERASEQSRDAGSEAIAGSGPKERLIAPDHESVIVAETSAVPLCAPSPDSAVSTKK